MDKTKEIDALYKILTLYEDIDNDKSPVTINSYLNYVDRLYVKWIGFGQADIYNTLKGLEVLGQDAGHRRVKSMVFHMIGVVERRL